MSKKISKSLPSELVLALSRSVSVASTRSRLSQVRNKKKDRERSRARYVGGSEGRGEKVWGKEEEIEKQEQEGREEWETPKLFGVIAVRSRFSPFLPVHNLLLLSRLFLFLLLLPF